MLYQIQNGTLSFGDKVILSHVDLEIKGREKLGLVGANGTGKTSLLKLIAGELSLDRDDRRQGKGILFSRKLKIQTLAQDNSRWLDLTLEEIMLEGFYEKECGRESELKYSTERFYYEQKYDRMLRDFGFAPEEKGKKLCRFSGGEQTKVMLVRMLMTESDLLLLDEPTNHLDSESVEALEHYLSVYDGAVLVVSHDRYFLDQVAEGIYELEQMRLKKYPGNYSAYRKEKRKQLEKQRKAYERQQEEIERNEQLIRQFKNKPRKAAFARSRKTMLDRMDRIEKPIEETGHIFTGGITPEYPGPKWMLQMEELQIGYSQEKPLLVQLELRIRRGQKIGVIGRNGVGKSTLLKTLTGQIPPLKGKYRLGEKVEIGYFDQHTGQMESEEKVSEYIHRLFPAMTEKEVYGKLASFLFRGSICQSKISNLSGGEKARLKLCELMIRCPNFLVLDEPTNHCDIPVKETMESAFQAYTGTILVISHDRYFLDQVADALLVLEEGKAFYYPFGYSHYMQSRKRMSDLIAKGISADDLPGMISTEDQALISSLKAVPKAAAIASRQMSDDEAYLDWKLRLAMEPLEKAGKRAEECWEQMMESEHAFKEQMLYEMGTEPEVTESEPVQEAKMQLEQKRKDYDRTLEQWTSECLEWYEIWSELEEQR